MPEITITFPCGYRMEFSSVEASKMADWGKCPLHLHCVAPPIYPQLPPEPPAYPWLQPACACPKGPWGSTIPPYCPLHNNGAGSSPYTAPFTVTLVANGANPIPSTDWMQVTA